MYWPTGAPKVYALSKHAIRQATITESHDGAESSEPSSGSVGGGEKALNPGEIGDDSTVQSVENGANGKINTRGEDVVAQQGEILAAKVSRGGSIFATITTSTLTIWQTKPIVALAQVIRSPQSMHSYGPNCALLLRPDALIIVVQTTQGYLITYSLATDPNARVYQTQTSDTRRPARKDSVDGYTRRPSTAITDAGPGEGDGIKEVNIRFRMVIRIDAGISRALALDDELVVATQKPAAVQCIRWVADNARAQTSTELLSKMSWISEKCTIVEMIHDRPMNLTCWITNNGRAYAVQRRNEANVDMDNPASLFQGFCFRDPETEDAAAVKTAINARFSLIAVGCVNGSIDVYVVKDYMGNIPMSHNLRLPVSSETSGMITFLSYSADGYCLVSGYEKGWAAWSVYGKPLASSFSGDRQVTKINGELWLSGVRDGYWIGGGSELVLLGMADDRLWTLDVVRNAVCGCFSPVTVSRGLLYSGNCFVIYKGHDVPDLTALPSDMSLWQSVQVPASYLLHQWPIKSAVASPDGKYVAVAGRRGLAHYSVLSGRWRTFDDLAAEHEFSVRGGMCWYQHFLIASVEASNRYQVRIYSREKSLSFSNTLHVEDLASPAIFTTVSGTDSLLVYTSDNTLLHFIIVLSATSVKLVQVGQIGFHGIIRAPQRVRSISWILPEDQLEHGDPSQDVATASVLFLVDGKLVLLQPSTNEQGELKYDMRVVAQNVEYYILLRDQPGSLPALKQDMISSSLPTGLAIDNPLSHSLNDSLWYFDGSSFHVWSDVQDVLASAPVELGRDLPPTVRIPVDFYPISVLVSKGIISGLDADLVQRRDVNFSYFKQSARTQLFLPQLLRYHLAEYNSPAALHLSYSYQHLPYFAHALEILLHDVLDNEVDNPPSPPETTLLPTTISFLSSFPAYLDIVVNCTRKTELRSWRTLFSYLPPVLDLFEESLAQGRLKTAAGYLLVLHTFEQESFQVHEFARLIRRAVAEHDWELCRELARFLVGIDSTGQTLRAALAETGDAEATNGNMASLDSLLVNGLPSGRRAGPEQRETGSRSERNGLSSQSGAIDYFSLQRTRETQDETFATPED